jgi:hypothetical protein
MGGRGNGGNSFIRAPAPVSRGYGRRVSVATSTQPRAFQVGAGNRNVPPWREGGTGGSRGFMTLSRGLNSKSHGYDSDEDDWDDTVSVASSSASTLVEFERSNHGLTMV